MTLHCNLLKNVVRLSQKEDNFMMTANREPLYWRSNKEWYRINREKDCFELTSKATERAKKSFEMYQKLQKRH